MNTMTKITTNTFFSASNDWSQAEIETAAEEYNKIKDTLERVALGKRDTVVLAGAAVRIFEKHGENSPLYKDFLESLKQNAPGWHDKFFRARAYDAYRGYNTLAGADSDKEFIWKLKPSLSALTECQNIHPSQQYDFLKDLKTKDKFPTKDAVSNFASGGRLAPAKKTTAASTSTYTASTTPYVAPVIEDVSTPVDNLITLDADEYNEIQSKAEVPKLSTNEQLVSQLLQTLNQLDLDALSVDKEAKALLSSHSDRLEILFDFSRETKSFKPTYV